MKKRKTIAAMLIILMFVISLIPSVFAADMTVNSASQRRKVRVGCFNLSSFQEVDEGGERSGYGDEYLQEIAKYTNWEYEYVNASWEKCLEMLEKGEIDLLGSAQRTPEREKIFDFPKLESGISYAALCVPTSNHELAYEDFDSFDGMHVGVLKGNSHNYAFDMLCEENNFTVRTTTFEHQEEMMQALHSGKVEAVLTSNLRKENDERIIAKFSPSPFYFVTTKGNDTLLKELNEAQNLIKVSNPHYDAELYERYYGIGEDEVPVFTRAECEFVSGLPPLKVSYIKSARPIEYTDSVTGEFQGMVRDVLVNIAGSSGLKFEYIAVDSVDEAYEMLSRGEIDIIGAVDSHYYSQSADDFILTNSYMSMLNVIVTDPNRRADNAFVAMTVDFSGTYKKQMDMRNVKIYPTVEDCFKALIKGDVSGVYAKTYIANSLCSDYKYGNLSLTALPKFKDNTCIGISKYADRRLLSVLNKSIQYISEDELQEVIIRNSTNGHDLTVIDIVYKNPVETMVVTSSLLLIVIAFLVYVYALRTKSNKRAFNLLYIDQLTGLWNFNYFKINLKRILASEHKCDYALVYMDIDRFKNYNAAYGYVQGDALLKGIAEILRVNLESDEMYARVANDNFVALMKYTDNASLVMRLKRFDNLMNATEITGSSDCRLFFISGAYILQPDDTDPSAVVDCANVARKTVKGQHRSCYAMYDDALRSHLLVEREIEATMEAALAEGQFVAFYQPKIDLKTTRVVGAEALIRWQHPTHGMMSPFRFIPTLEKNEFIVEIDMYVLECVCRTLRSHIDSGIKPLPISSNLSRLHFTRPGLVKRVCKIVDSYRIPHELIELEITENMMDEHADALLAALNDLRAAGFGIAMDDFGSGYSSLNLLKNIPVDTLKLDREFLQKGIDSEKERIIIGGFVSIAQRLDMSVVCEGVETQEQATFLRGIGCEAAQGYLFAKPMPLEDYEKRIKVDY